MIIKFVAPMLLACTAVTASAQSDDTARLKDAAIASIDAQRATLIRMSDAVWAHAETALYETESSRLLADYAEQQGVDVERGVAGMPKAFIASDREGRPIMGCIG